MYTMYRYVEDMEEIGEGGKQGWAANHIIFVLTIKL